MAKEKTKSEVAENKTRCFKRIGRKIQPKQFESLEVTCEYEDEVVWTDNVDRQQKLDNLTNLALIDFDRSMQIVCESLGVEHRPVSITLKKADGITQGVIKTDEPLKNVSPKTDDLSDWFDGLEGKK